MRKRDLHALPVATLSAENVKVLTLNPKGEIFIRATQESVAETDVIVISVFLREQVSEGTVEPAFRTFLWENDYTSEVIGESHRWLTGMIESILHSVYRLYYRPVFLGIDTVSLLANFLGCEHDSVDQEILEHQSAIVRARRNRRYQKIMDHIDSQMAGIPDLPEDISRYIDRKLVKDRFMIYTYQKGAKQQKGVCTACESTVRLDKTRHGREMSCPACNARVQMKAALRMGRSVSVTGRIGIIQRSEKGAVVRYFSYEQMYIGSAVPETKLTEYGRLMLLKDGKLEEYDYGIFPPMDGFHRWRPLNDKFSFFNAPMYPCRESVVYRGSVWRYLKLRHYAEMFKDTRKNYWGQSSSFHEFARTAAKYPQIEYLHKMGLEKLIYDLAHEKAATVNHAGKNPATFLGLNKQHTKLMISLNAGAIGLKMLQQAQENGRTLNADEGAFFLMTSEQGVPNEKVMLAMRYATPHKIMRYIRERIEPAENMTASDWIDYVEACQTLKYNLHSDFVLFPRNPKEAHDDTLSLVDCGSLDEAEKTYAKIYKKYVGAYQYIPDRGEFIVCVPESLYQIVREGHTLRHCVKTYAKRVASGSTMILFIRNRDAPDKSFFTLEVHNGRVFQCRGFNNGNMTREVKAFVDEYAETVLQNQGRNRRRKAG